MSGVKQGRTGVRFRSEIEGLRGVAVLMVVLAHARLPFLPGGYVGVDVFFVISGFLITGLLQQELQATGSIDVRQFYARRIRRLLPAFGVMLVATAALALWLLPSSSWGTQAEAARWAALWASNMFFAGADSGYFDQGAEANLYLHTWSLSAEEQFYLIWPTLIGLAWKFGRRRGATTLVWALVLLGFVLTVAATALEPLHAYYQMPCRLWQLALGAGVQLSAGQARLSLRRVHAARAVGCLLLVVAALCLAPDRISYPGLWALLPTLAAALLLLNGPDGWRDAWLDLKPLRFLGRLSYSWYLWHWPVLVLGFSLAGRTPSVGLVAAALSLVPAWLSWRLVEQRVRTMERGRATTWVLAGLLVSAVLAYAAMAWEQAAFVPGRSDTRNQALLTTLTTPVLYRQPGCDEWFHADRLVPCTLVRATSEEAPTVVLAGDSVAAQWSTALESIARARGWNLVVLTKSSCPMLDHPFVYPRINRRYVECERWRDRVVAYLHERRPTLLVLGSSAAYAFDPADWERGTRRFLTRIEGAAQRTVLLAPTPLLPFDGPQCALARSGQNGHLARECSVPLPQVRPSALIARLQAAVAGHASVRLVDLGDAVCPGQTCSAERNGVLLYRDGQHLNASYVLQLAPALDAALDRPSAR